MPTQTNAKRGMLMLLAPNAKNAEPSAFNLYLAFQYIPEKLVHTLTPPIPNAQATTVSNTPAYPVEHFSLSFDLDSVDVDASVASGDFGVHPALALLETMMQPQTYNKQVYAPIVVFRWGSKRQVAARIVSLNVEENAFDASLNPTRAMVALTLKVLDPSEVQNSNVARTVVDDHQKQVSLLVDEYKSETGQTPVGSVKATTAGLAAGATAGALKA